MFEHYVFAYVNTLTRIRSRTIQYTIYLHWYNKTGNWYAKIQNSTENILLLLFLNNYRGGKYYNIQLHKLIFGFESRSM